MTIITVISQQPLTTEQVNSFKSVPSGGLDGQVLTKASNANFDLVWEDAGGSSSTTNLSIANKTATTFDLLSSTGTDVTVPAATTTEAGLLIATDKVKLNNLGTASYLNVPASGNAANGEVVKGNDTRLSDARTPLGHSHVIADVTGLQTALDGKFNNPIGDTTQYIAGDGSLISFPIATAGTYKSITINAKGQVTGGTNPTTLSGYGITDAQGLNATLTSLSGLSTVTTGNVKLTNGVASLDTNTYYLASNPNGYTTNTGTVTTASVVSANGFAGTVATAGTTPAITISTSVTGLLKGNGTAISAATAGTDYLTPTGNGSGLTNFTSGQITTALGFTPYSAANPSGYTTNTGTVTTASIVTANGFSGSVVNATTTPAITLTLQNATTGQSGQLTSADWNTFNGKQAALSGTGFVKISGTTISYDNSTYLTGNQTITVTGDVSGSGTTAVTLNLGSNVVTNAKLAQVATATFKGRITASTGNVEDLTASQATSLLDVFTTSSKGLVGASGGGTTNFLRADGTWAAPSGGGGGLTLTEFEVDFGTKPIRSKKFTITAAGVSGSSKIIVNPSGNVATGRVGDDWEWDAISTSAKAGTGQFVLTCFASGKVAGKRKFYYTYS